MNGRKAVPKTSHIASVLRPESGRLSSAFCPLGSGATGAGRQQAQPGIFGQTFPFCDRMN